MSNTPAAEKSITASILEQAKKAQPEIVKVRRHIHENPELSFHETKTAKFAAEKLQGLGYKVKSGVGKTGVLGDMGTGTRIAIRADMDGLPIDETPTNGFTSKNKGVMHACGHDGHVACALSAAEILSNLKVPGAIRMLMQPAEELGDDEGKSGARRMVDDGALDGCAAIIGLHMDATMQVGKVGLRSGPLMAAGDGFTVTVTGKGGHGAFPEAAVDAVAIGAQVVQAIHQIVSRRVSATDPAIVSLGSFQSSSTRGNVISERVILEGTIRTFNKEVRKTIMAELERACSIARVLGGDYSIAYEEGYPVVINDPEVTKVMWDTACDIVGPENVIELTPKCWSEDFSMFQEVIPGAFMFLGARIDGDERMHHTERFDLNEQGFYIGTAILAETARRLIPHMEKLK